MPAIGSGIVIGAVAGGLIGLLISLVVDVPSLSSGPEALLLAVIGGIGGFVSGFVIGAGNGPSPTSENETSGEIDVITVSIDTGREMAKDAERHMRELGAQRSFREASRIPDESF